MALNIQPFQFNYRALGPGAPPPSTPVWGPPDMSKQLTEGIGNIIPNLMKQYDDMNQRRLGFKSAQELDRAKAALEAGGQYTTQPGTAANPYAGNTGGVSQGQYDATKPLNTDIEAKIAAASAQSGLPADYYRRIIGVESKGVVDIKNPNSGAMGLFQFLPSTGKQYGVTAQNLGDVDNQFRAFNQFTMANKAELTAALGREPTLGELGVAHQQGVGGAIKLARADPSAPVASVLGKNATSNMGELGKNATVDQFRSYWANRYGGTGFGPAAAPTTAKAGGGAVTYVAPGAAAAAGSGGQAPQPAPGPEYSSTGGSTGAVPRGPAPAAAAPAPAAAPLSAQGEAIAQQISKEFRIPIEEARQRVNGVRATAPAAPGTPAAPAATVAPAAAANQPLPPADPRRATAQQAGQFVSPDLQVTQDYAPGQRFGRTATADAQPFSGIVLHHTATPDLQSALAIAKGDPNRGGNPYGYHFIIDRDGSVHQAAPMTARTNHTLPGQGYDNKNSIGVSMVGNSKDATPQQIEAATKLTKQLQGQYGIGLDRVAGHGQIRGEKEADEGLPVLAALRGQGGPQTAAAAPGAGAPQPVQPGAPQAVAAAAPGVVPRSGPTQGAVSSGQNQPPLFSTPQLGGATGAPQGEAPGGGPGQQPIPPQPQEPYQPAQLASAQAVPGMPQPGATMPGTLSDVSPPQPMPGAPQPPPVQPEPPPQPRGPQVAGVSVEPQVPPIYGTVQRSEPIQPVIDEAAAKAAPNPSVRRDSGPGQRHDPNAAPAPVVAPPVVAPVATPAPAAAAPAPPVSSAGVALPPQTQASLSRLGITTQAMADISPHMIGALARAVESGNPQFIQAVTGAVNAITSSRAGGAGDGGWTYHKDPKTGQEVRFNSKTGERQVINPGRQDEKGNTTDQILNAGDPERAKYKIDPNDPRPWRLTRDAQGDLKPEPLAMNPSQERADQISKDLEGQQSFKEYKGMRGAVGALDAAFSEKTSAGDFNGVLQVFKAVDPNSTVTQNEQTGAIQIGPVTGWLQAWKAKFDGNGGFLTPELRAEFYNAAQAQLHAKWNGGVKDDVMAARRKGDLLGPGLGDMATNWAKDPGQFVRRDRDYFDPVKNPSPGGNPQPAKPRDPNQPPPPRAGEPGASRDNAIPEPTGTEAEIRDRLSHFASGTWFKPRDGGPPWQKR